jgi:arylsulfatase
VVQRPKGSINNGLMFVGDIMPTLLAIAGTSYPKVGKDGHELPPLIGKPWNDVLAGRADSPRTPSDYIAWEIFGNRAVRQGDWKLRWQFKPYGTGDWELYNVTTDPGERSNVAAQNPEKVQALLALWDGYAKANNVILPSRGPYETLAPRYDQLPVRVPVDEGFPALIYQRQFVPPADMLAEPKP